MRAAIRSLPRRVTRGLSAAQLGRVDGWWHRLRPEDRRALAASWRDEDGGLGPGVQLVGRFVDPADAEEHAAWTDELREFVQNADVPFFLLDGRQVHICRAHPEARRVGETGFVPAGFRCPLAHRACPLATAAARRPGQALRLEVRVVGEILNGLPTLAGVTR